MKAYHILPDDYRIIFAVDLQKDKKLLLLINSIAVIIGIILAVPMHFRVSIANLFDMESGIGAYFIRFSVLVLGLIAYIFLHELVHGITMKLCGTNKVKYGFTGIYAYAGSDDYYNKSGYVAIALAPVVIWGIILAIINVFVPIEWFWVVYIIQISNISGAAGDFYVTYKFMKFPNNILIKDSGVGMEVYSNKSL